MATLATLRTNVAAKLGLDNTASSFDQGLIDAWLNDAVVHIVDRTRTNVVSATMTLTAGKYDYTLDTSILAINEVYLTDASTSIWYKLQRNTPQQILDLRVGTQFLGSPPVRWYAVNGSFTLMVYPTPATADVITMYYVARPAAMSASSDSPTDIPTEYHKAVEYWACAEAGAYINDSPSQNGETYRKLFEAEMVLLRKSLRQKGGLKLSPAVVGRSARRNTPIGQPSQQNV